MPNTTVTFALDGNLSLKSFAFEIEHFRKLIEALSTEIARKAKITWLLDDLDYSSAIATVRGEAADLRPVEQVVAAYASVGRALERGQRPPYSPRVVKEAEQIVALLDVDVESIRFETPEDEAIVRSTSAGKPASLPSLSAYGAVEGQVQTLTSRGGLRFTLYDTLRDKAVSCYLQDGQQEMMRGIWGQRAVVEGWVTRDAETGRATAIRRVRGVHLLHDVPAGSYRHAIGILPRKDNDPLPEESIRRLRDA